MVGIAMRVPLRGRAILRRVTPHESVRAYRAGDFVLTTSEGGEATLLGMATASDLNHAAIIVDALGTTVEANPNLIADPRAFRTSCIADYLRAGRPVWIGYVELREGSRDEVVAYAEHLVRSRAASGLGARLLLALHALVALAPRTLVAHFGWTRALAAYLDDHGLVIRGEHCFASGELVARALERGGFIWDRDPANVTPAFLFERYALREPAQVTPMPLHRLRPPSRSGPHRGPGAPVTRFAPRATRGATALAPTPRRSEQPQPGLRALLRVGMLAAASLTAITVAEELLRELVRE
jgi:hypothetical protein